MHLLRKGPVPACDGYRHQMLPEVCRRGLALDVAQGIRLTSELALHICVIIIIIKLHLASQVPCAKATI
jgi:hypothetical protein